MPNKIVNFWGVLPRPSWLENIIWLFSTNPEFYFTVEFYYLKKIFGYLQLTQSLFYSLILLLKEDFAKKQTSKKSRTKSSPSVFLICDFVGLKNAKIHRVYNPI